MFVSQTFLVPLLLIRALYLALRSAMGRWPSPCIGIPVWALSKARHRLCATHMGQPENAAIHPLSDPRQRLCGVPCRGRGRLTSSRRQFMRCQLLSALVLTYALIGTAWAESGTAMPRVGKSCPSGYFKSGEYCAQGSDRATPAMSESGGHARRGTTEQGTTAWLTWTRPSRPSRGKASRVRAGTTGPVSTALQTNKIRVGNTPDSLVVTHIGHALKCSRRRFALIAMLS